MSDRPQELKPRTKGVCVTGHQNVFHAPEGRCRCAVLGKQFCGRGHRLEANYREASRGRSKAEFVSKIGDCLKEIEETEYWFELLVDSGCVPRTKMADLLDETRQLNAILTTIAKRAKE